MDRQLAYVVLDKDVAPDMRAVTAALSKLHPNATVSSGADTVESVRGSPIIRCAGDTLIIMPLPVPMPRDAWEMPARRATALWPQAIEAFAGHRAHIVVSTVAPTQNRLRTARSIAAVVGAILASVPGCCAVLWEGLVAHSPADWLELSQNVFAPYPRFPYPLWVSIHTFCDGETTGAITFGLS